MNDNFLITSCFSSKTHIHYIITGGSEKKYFTFFPPERCDFFFLFSDVQENVLSTNERQVWEGDASYLLL